MTFKEARELGIYNPAFLRRLEEREERRKRAAAMARRASDRNQKRLAVEMTILEAGMQAEKARSTLVRAFAQEGEKIPVKVIIQAVGLLHRIAPDELTGRGRNKEIVRARFDAYALVKYLRPDHSLAMIAREFGRDHTSVLLGLRSRGWDGARWIDDVPEFSSALGFLTRTRRAA